MHDHLNIGAAAAVSTTAPAVAHLEAKQHQQRPTRSLLEVEPALQWDAVALCGVGAITQGHELELFHGIHGYLQVRCRFRPMSSDALDAF